MSTEVHEGSRALRYTPSTLPCPTPGNSSATARKAAASGEASGRPMSSSFDGPAGGGGAASCSARDPDTAPAWPGADATSSSEEEFE